MYEFEDFGFFFFDVPDKYLRFSDFKSSRHRPSASARLISRGFFLGGGFLW